MLFRVSGHGRPSSPAGRSRRRRRPMAVARLGDAAGDEHDGPRRRGGRMRALIGRLFRPRLRLRALLLRSRRALARLRDWYDDMMRRLIADAAAAEPAAKARKEFGAETGGETATTVADTEGKPVVVVPAVVAGAVLRCNSHYYIR